ncbi:hypothetical protein FJZ31_36510 [Candidatus Poribacteria bacterium]|nr:hypothetical protein [Candidatus Poribacteria bacterium]
MPKREIGLMGYIGEAVVEQWLKSKYPENLGYKVLSQAIPNDVLKEGGGYLDFCVIKNDVAHSIYEVKSQDYIWGKDSNLNRALKHIWQHPAKISSIFVQGDKSYKVDKSFRAYLILLVGPNESGINKFGGNIKNVILFSDIWKDLNNSLDTKMLMKNITTDISKVMKILKNPTQGKRVTKKFLELRRQLNNESTSSTHHC